MLCRAARAGPEPAIAAAVLSIALSRREPPSNKAHAFVTPFAIAGVGLVAAGVGWLLVARPVVGAVVFTGAMFLSIWLRNFGENARLAGTLIALPLVAMLVVPVRPGTAPGGPLEETILIACAGLIAFAYSAAIRAGAKAAGMTWFAVARPPRNPPSDGPARSGLPVPTRMAIQMAVALAAAFAVGVVAFRGHWAWTVLTAFIVCSGAVGRGDAAYKGVLRLIGAIGGTVAAATVTHVWTPTGAVEALAIFIVLFFGLWLRDVNYAYWACSITLILALLGPTNDGTNLGFLVVRLEAILAGAVCAVAATWFVLPIKTEAVVRRRLADALRALDELAGAHQHDPEQPDRVALFEYRLAELDRVAAPLRWHGRIFARSDALEHPARWIELASRLREPARTIGAHAPSRGPDRAAIRRAIGVSRRAVANHGKLDAPPGAVGIGVALRELHNVFASANGPRH